jgi:hypothetical protein
MALGYGLGPTFQQQPTTRRSSLTRIGLFSYLVHVPVIHLIAALYSRLRYGGVGWWAVGPPGWPAGYMPDITLAWVVWTLVTVALYPLCAWFAGVKRRRRSPLLSFL